MGIMLKKISLLSLCFIVGCTVSKLAVIDLKPYEGLSAFAYISAEGADVKKPDVSPPVPTDIIPLSKCKCKGTGRSGDGLGPCNCPKNCYCKQNNKKTEEVVIENDTPLAKQVFYFHGKDCKPCKAVDKQFEKLKETKLGWKIVEKKNGNETKTAAAHFIIVDTDKFPVDEINQIPHMILVVNGKVVKEVNPYGMTFAEIASFYYEN